MDFQTIAKLRNYLEIAHHVPGRIRIRFRPAIATDPAARRLFKEHDALPPGVNDLRLNLMARSVVIEYAQERIPPDLLEDLVRAEDDAEAEDHLRTLDNILRTLSPKEET